MTLSFLCIFYGLTMDTGHDIIESPYPCCLIDSNFIFVSLMQLRSSAFTSHSLVDLMIKIKFLASTKYSESLSTIVPDAGDRRWRPSLLELG